MCIRDSCNLAASIYPTITREPGATFEAALAQVHAARSAASAGLPGLGQALALEAALALPYVLAQRLAAVSYTHLRAHETVLDLVCRLLLEKKNTSTHILLSCNNVAPSTRLTTLHVGTAYR
mgnify:CR=1 FL=1